ncbi:MAG: hypothetical protein IKO27_06640 [Ruminococcus sp.]|nr:hypothetical protein [Ruminococcus sp.]
MYNNVKLDKSLYSITGKSFTEALRQLDPDENYAGTELAGLDAFERQLKRFNIKVSGADSDRVEKFFASSESAVLFPEYVRRMIKQGMNDASILPEIVAAVSYTDSIDFRGLTVTVNGTDAGVGQGGTLPVTDVELASEATELTKFARKLSCTYESIRKQRLEAFGVILRSLGAQISKAVNKLAVDTLTDDITPSTISGDSITYADLAAFWASMGDKDMTTMVCSPAMMAQILALDEMKYCVSDYMSSGKVRTPYGVTIVKCSAVTDGDVVGIDKSCAAEMAYGTDVVVDFDKLISTQCDEIACSVTVGFSALTAGAVKVLTSGTT